MKDAASIPQEFNPNYEERRKEFQPANTNTARQVKQAEASRTQKAGNHPPARQEEQDVPTDTEAANGAKRR